MKKFWAWILKHKVASIVIASIVAVGTTCAIVIPIATRHKHDFGSDLKHNDTHHWYLCECGAEKDRLEHGYGSRLKHDDTQHWSECVCGVKGKGENHVYDQSVVSNDYLKRSASRYDKAVYYKSCKCGMKGTETFEVDKLSAKLEVEISSKVYDGKEVSFTYQTRSKGRVTTGFKMYDSTQGAWVDIGTDKPKHAGKYQLVVQVEETNIYTAETITQEFEISKRQLNGLLELNIKYGDTIKISGRPSYYYDYILSATEYGLVEGESVRIRAIYNSQEAGTVCDIWELFEESNYEKGTLELAGTTISAIEVEIYQDFTLTPGQTEYAYTLTPEDGVINGETVILKVEFEEAAEGAGIISKKLYINDVEATNYVLGDGTTLNLVDPWN